MMNVVGHILLIVAALYAARIVSGLVYGLMN